jgi:hypothetical protein
MARSATASVVAKCLGALIFLSAVHAARADIVTDCVFTVGFYLLGW